MLFRGFLHYVVSRMVVLPPNQAFAKASVLPGTMVDSSSDGMPPVTLATRGVEVNHVAEISQDELFGFEPTTLRELFGNSNSPDDYLGLVSNARYVKGDLLKIPLLPDDFNAKILADESVDVNGREKNGYRDHESVVKKGVSTDGNAATPDGDAAPKDAKCSAEAAADSTEGTTRLVEVHDVFEDGPYKVNTATVANVDAAAANVDAAVANVDAAVSSVAVVRELKKEFFRQSSQDWSSSRRDSGTTMSQLGSGPSCMDPDVPVGTLSTALEANGHLSTDSTESLKYFVHQTNAVTTYKKTVQLQEYPAFKKKIADNKKRMTAVDSPVENNSENSMLSEFTPLEEEKKLHYFELEDFPKNVWKRGIELVWRGRNNGKDHPSRAETTHLWHSIVEGAAIAEGDEGGPPDTRAHDGAPMGSTSATNPYFVQPFVDAPPSKTGPPLQNGSLEQKYLAAVDEKYYTSVGLLEQYCINRQTQANDSLLQ